MKWVFVVVFILANAVLFAEPKTGLIGDFPIDTKLFPTTRDYYKSNVPRKVFRAYDDGNIPSGWKKPEISVDECIEYNPAEHTTLIYVPESYRDDGSFGVYLHNSPGNRGISPSAEWKAVFDKFKLIYVSAHKTPNGSPDMRRVVLAMDSLATVRKHYKVDDKRVFVGGLSGGGHMGMMCQMLYPEQFNGAISHAAQSYLPDGRSCGHFPGLSYSDARRGLRKKLKWCVVSGDKDFNYKEILKTSAEWNDAGFEYKFFDHKGMGHTNASGPALKEALTWVGASPPESTGSATPAASKEHEFRTWTAINGKTIEAKLVADKGVRVVLVTKEGKEISVYTTRLSAADRKYLRD